MASARAIVCRGRHDESGWKIEDVELRALQGNELLIRTVASGICHTDVMFGDNPETIGGFPRVMGHEG
jgi:Zn-dependent alcohol dehydrogenase